MIVWQKVAIGTGIVALAAFGLALFFPRSAHDPEPARQEFKAPVLDANGMPIDPGWSVKWIEDLKNAGVASDIQYSTYTRLYVTRGFWNLTRRERVALLEKTSIYSRVAGGSVEIKIVDAYTEEEVGRYNSAGLTLKEQ